MDYHDNFKFVNDIYPEVYQYLSNTEKSARISVKSAGVFLRNAFEAWCNHHIKELPDSDIIIKKPLAEKIQDLMTNNRLPNEAYTYYTYIDTTGKKRRGKAHELWRRFGNESSHIDGTNNVDNPKASFSNLIVVLKLIHCIFKAEYEAIKGKPVSHKTQFKEAFIPIGNNRVIAAKEPADEEKTGCVMEYYTFLENEKTHVTTYSIIREYRKNIIENQLRGYKAQFIANSYKGIFNNVQVSIIPSDEYWEQNEKCYIVYSFMNRPMGISNSFFRKNECSLQDMRNLVLDIAILLHNFHTVNPPIYHRNLSFDSIYVCKKGDGTFEPSIIKFDYAKIMFDSTVIHFVEKVRDSGTAKIMKYRAPELDKYFEREMKEEPSWEKADIYSLGMLAGELLKKKITDTAPTREELISQSVPENIVDIIDSMLTEIPSERSDISLLIEALRGWDVLSQSNH